MNTEKSVETMVGKTMERKTGDTNRLGLSKADYSGGKSTLCTGCGHDSITNHIITALHQSSMDPYSVTKLSGIGCSSKTPAYFLSRSHGFNSIHGRMAPVATGVHLANRRQFLIGVSGDGDTASIGLGSFAHMLRRNVPLLYLVENNGVYGLTKGQFSATAEEGSRAKSGVANPFQGIDLCTLAIEMGCGFVARSFSGDARQLVPLLNLAFRHRGTAFIDVISPCITFANHEGSTRSFEAVRAQNVHLQELGFIQPQQEIKVDYGEGEAKEIELHDGSRLILRKLASSEHDVNRKDMALARLHEAKARGEFLTGLFYWDQKSRPLAETMNLVDQPLSQLADETRPPKAALDRMMDRFR
ncbi:MAG: thiamine pyrophosphate-dependent enzyme [Bdellovibrionales bacterium]